MTAKTDWELNDPVWICDEMAGWFHYRRSDGMVRVGFSEWITGKGPVGRWAEVPESWLTERVIRKKGASE
jgi:hypothetical protein